MLQRQHSGAFGRKREDVCDPRARTARPRGGTRIRVRGFPGRRSPGKNGGVPQESAAITIATVAITTIGVRAFSAYPASPRVSSIALVYAKTSPKDLAKRRQYSRANRDERQISGWYDGIRRSIHRSSLASTMLDLARRSTSQVPRFGWLCLHSPTPFAPFSSIHDRPNAHTAERRNDSARRDSRWTGAGNPGGGTGNVYVTMCMRIPPPRLELTAATVPRSASTTTVGRLWGLAGLFGPFGQCC